MEGGCLTFATGSSAPPSPKRLFNSHDSFLVKQFQKNHTKLIPTSTSNHCTASQHRGIRSLSVKASEKDFSTRKQTLSSNWEVSNYSSPSWLPSFEELDITNMLLRQRIAFLGSTVDDNTADLIVNLLLFLDAEDQKKDIKLFVNSAGGSPSAAMGIYDAMKLCNADISTICWGIAASMCAIIVASGTKGKRLCMPNGKLLLHEPRGGVNSEEMSAGCFRVRESGYHRVKMVKILAYVTGRPEEKVDRDMERDLFMTAWEAKEYGLVDAIVEDGKPGWVVPIVDASPPPSLKMSPSWNQTAYKKGRDRKNLPSEEKLPQP